MNIYCDNDIIGGLNRIVGHKHLEEDDIEFHLICRKIRKKADIATDTMVADSLVPEAAKYDLYIEWGTASVTLAYEKISEKLKSYLQEYRDPHEGVALSIFPNIHREDNSRKMDLLNACNAEVKQEIFTCLGIDPGSDFDAFAASFQGLSKRAILARFN